MSRFKRQLLLIASVLGLMFLSSCVSLLQEVTVRQDGSGTMKFALGIETEFYEQFMEMIPEGYELENLLTTLLLNEGVSDVQQDTYQAEGRTWESIQMEIDDAALLFAEDRSFGPVTMSITQDQDGYMFEQTLDLADSNMSIPGANLLDLTGAGYTVRLITPQITSTNGLLKRRFRPLAH